MAEALDAAIRDALLQYARARELDQRDVDTGGLEACEPPENVDDSEAANTAASVKKTKMLRVARMLVDSNPRIRNKGMASVGSFLESFQELTEDELLHVWSTLYYAAWLSDKPLVQRDFFVRASLLHRRLRCPRAKTLFFCSFFRVLVAEWGKIDRHRTNKFLLFCRIFLAEWMHVMRLMNWEETFVKMAMDFLCEEIMLRGNARGVALHLVEVLTEEFRMLLDPVAHPTSNSGNSDAISRPEREQEERLCAFSWLFVPFLRCCCFSKDAILVARIHERSLRTLGQQDVDLQFAAATLFSLASDKRVRNENRKQLFSSYEQLKEGANEVAPKGEASNRRVGTSTAASFAQLMVQRVIADAGVQQQNKQELYDPMKEFPNRRKRAAATDIDRRTAEAQSEPDDNAAASDKATPVLPKNVYSAEKRLRLQQKQQQGEESLPTATDAGGGMSHETPARKIVKDKLRKGQPLNGKRGGHMTPTDDATVASGLRLPIRSSGNKGGSAKSTSDSPTGDERSTRKVPFGPGAVSGHSPAETQSAGQSTPSGSDCSAGAEQLPSAQGPAAAMATATSGEAKTGELPSLRRSPRICETSPSSKRVLFNLKKNKIVAFSRHAPSLAVGPASPPPANGAGRGSMAAPTPVKGSRSLRAPPRGILRAAKELGPPTSEETAPLPPIRKSQRPPWWGGATAELMAILRGALAKRLGASSDGGSAKQKKKKIKLKRIKRVAKHTHTSAPSRL